MPTFDLSQYGITVKTVYRNAEPSVLYEQALRRNEGEIVASGALATRSGQKTGRSPKDKRVVDMEPSNKDVWWGNVNTIDRKWAGTTARKQDNDFGDEIQGNRGIKFCSRS